MERPRPHLLGGIVLAILLTACGGSATVTVTGTDELTFDPETLSAPAGEQTVELTSEAGAGHTFVIEGVNADEPVVEAAAGETATGAVTLEPGSYTFYCSIPGHRAAGMEGTLDVEG